MSRILVVDDEPQILRALRINLSAQGYDVRVAADGAQALARAAEQLPDVIILDLGLPDTDGVDVIRGLRGWSSTSIIVLSGRAGSDDKVDALDAGADDYVTKPFAVDELLARLRAVSRRAATDDDTPVFPVGDHLVDLGARRVTTLGASAEADLRLIPTKWHVLETLLRHPGNSSAKTNGSPKCRDPPTPTNSTTYVNNWPVSAASSSPARPRHLLTEPWYGIPLPAVTAVGEYGSWR